MGSWLETATFQFEADSHVAETPRHEQLDFLTESGVRSRHKQLFKYASGRSKQAHHSASHQRTVQCKSALSTLLMPSSRPGVTPSNSYAIETHSQPSLLASILFQAYLTIKALGQSSTLPYLLSVATRTGKKVRRAFEKALSCRCFQRHGYHNNQQICRG